MSKFSASGISPSLSGRVDAAVMETVDVRDAEYE